GTQHRRHEEEDDQQAPVRADRDTRDAPQGHAGGDAPRSRAPGGPLGRRLERGSLLELTARHWLSPPAHVLQQASVRAVAGSGAHADRSQTLILGVRLPRPRREGSTGLPPTSGIYRNARRAAAGTI